MRAVVTTGEVPAPRPSSVRVLLGGALVFFVAWAFFAWNAPAQPVFVDETAYVAQSYFWDLLKRGKRDDWAWVEYHAYDLPPLEKYLAGIALELGGHRHPGRSAANAWFRNINAQVVPPAIVKSARWPTFLLGALGCVAVYAIGTLAGGCRVGWLAALLLMINPLYRLLAERAMSDVPAESFVIVAEAMGLWLWIQVWKDRISWIAVTICSLLIGACAGLATLAKLNGLLSILVIWGWAILGAVVSDGIVRRSFMHFVSVAIVSLSAQLVFVALNPYLLARPSGAPPSDLVAPVADTEVGKQRLTVMIGHRIGVSRQGQRDFADNALQSLLEKTAAVVVQGFGRFGPFGPPHSSTTPYPRFAWDRDWGALVWLPCVLVGAIIAARSGLRDRRMGKPPAGWALLLWLVVTGATVTLFIPLAWDRYYLPLIPVSAVLGALAVVTVVDELLRRVTSRSSPQRAPGSA